ncbi:MAG: iron-containing alcohol dehydrogenase, partial [Desulfopila sp.]|nr:iron-containing alcohol dehydrogenase [Desulfopila sp.]
MDINFSSAPIPRIIFGTGQIYSLPAIVAAYGSRVLLLLGSASFQKTPQWVKLQQLLAEGGNVVWVEHIHKEPTPECVDEISGRYRNEKLHVVVAIGGGSTLDGGKAVAAMLACSGGVTQYLEGVGHISPTGTKLPFIAVPTTSGTGSEVTCNAVISRIGSNGFKKSLRHQNYTPDVAVLDPALTSTCPQEITVNCAMDAFSQLVESYLSSKASPLTDDLALGAIKRIRTSLAALCRGDGDIGDRSKMMYAACISGITLTNAGLGIVHGFASAIGGLFPIPHGLVCGTLMAAANEVTLCRLREEAESGRAALKKYVQLGRLFSSREKAGDTYYQDSFIAMLHQLTSAAKLAVLGKYGVREDDLDTIIQQSDCKNNPV